MQLPRAIPKRKNWIGRLSRLPLWVFLSFVVILSSATGVIAGTPGEGRTLFTNSITQMPSRIAATAHEVRRDHLGKTMEFEIPLRMRGYPKLLEKIGLGAGISQTE